MVLKSRISPDIFLHIPPVQPHHLKESASRTTQGHEHGHSDSVNVHLIFLVTGNPGLIGYYHPFLSQIVDLLRDDADGDAVATWTSSMTVVAGFSLGGFEVEDYKYNKNTSHGDGLRRPGIANGNYDDGDNDDNMRRQLLFPDHGHYGEEPSSKKIYSLQEQIALCYARLQSLVRRVTEHVEASTDMSGQHGSDINVNVKVKVTLMGHSVGAYIALELVRLCHEKMRRSSQDGGYTTEPTETTETTQPWSIASCILLTPTIQDLHLSSSGRIATPLLTSIPIPLPTLLQSLVSHVLVATLPASWLKWLVSRVTSMNAESHGMETTLAFLTSATGVRQALYMAKCELLEIRTEKWGEEVWGASGGGGGGGGGEEDGEIGVGGQHSPNLFFWFAKQDHWVADATRDELFNKRRGQHIDDDGSISDGRARNAKTHFRIDEADGLVHAWCLGQSDLVAKRVSRWLKEVT
ncbi:hypothetical protein PV10_05908 [Exophiala mesophila]|uniref:Uncharacterized protein n=1 Tax=Exophiala mesophila TaxID=212818 RepID=A0A0D1Z9G6_EXOME|nr:uncharacterized protein PV10_05908 [Exophiala mesophila]KIV91362.1 hypothetical protein PV10_05908 [Exophiala mesophila]